MSAPAGAMYGCRARVVGPGATNGVGGQPEAPAPQDSPDCAPRSGSPHQETPLQGSSTCGAGPCPASADPRSRCRETTQGVSREGCSGRGHSHTRAARSVHTRAFLLRKGLNLVVSRMSLRGWDSSSAWTTAPHAPPQCAGAHGRGSALEQCTRPPTAHAQAPPTPPPALSYPPPDRCPAHAPQ